MGSKWRSTWAELGHVLVGGMTGYGKSNFLKLMVGYAISDGLELYLGDGDAMTFGPVRGHELLAHPIADEPDKVSAMMDAVLDEIRKRAKAFDDAKAEDIDDYNATSGDKLRRVLVVLDEFNSLTSAMGGPKGDFAKKVARLAWIGRKFGVTLVIAGQTFHADVVGPVRDQMKTKVCFRVKNATISRVILDEEGAESLVEPGLAIVQIPRATFRVRVPEVKKAQWKQVSSASRPASGMTLAMEKVLTTAMVENGDKVTKQWLVSRHAMTQKEANEVRVRLLEAGYVTNKDESGKPFKDNAWMVNRKNREVGSLFIITDEDSKLEDRWLQ